MNDSQHTHTHKHNTRTQIKVKNNTSLIMMKNSTQIYRCCVVGADLCSTLGDEQMTCV